MDWDTINTAVWSLFGGREKARSITLAEIEQGCGCYERLEELSKWAGVIALDRLATMGFSCEIERVPPGHTLTHIYHRPSGVEETIVTAWQCTVAYDRYQDDEIVGYAAGDCFRDAVYGAIADLDRWAQGRSIAAALAEEGA